jgi:large subunit ribosomal protein L4
VGGGVAFGPHPRDYSEGPQEGSGPRFPEGSCERILAGDVLLVEAFDVAEAKTKQFLALVGEAGGQARKT